MSSSDVAELSSLETQLDELVTRCAAVGDRYRDTPDSSIAAELDAAERQLIGARRALLRAANALGG